MRLYQEMIFSIFLSIYINEQGKCRFLDTSDYHRLVLIGIFIDFLYGIYTTDNKKEQKYVSRSTIATTFLSLAKR